ncbi:hypothetical protein EXE43_15750 [Halorubrum sp. SS5]|nr:hypothetical protein EXE43_15750 [Halorubrum sp. SS5]
MSYLSDEQREKLTDLLAKEVALTGTVDGERFEMILTQVLEDATHINKKLFFDIKQPSRGIEAKTYKLQTKGIGPGSSLRNVLKRIPPDGMPDDIMYEGGEDIQVDTSVPASRVGEAVLSYLRNDLIENHAQQLGINGSYDFATLFRNKPQNKMAYWEETIEIGNADEFDWQWSDKALEGRKDGERVYTWYYQNQRQLFYYFVAPDDVEVLDIPEFSEDDVNIFTRNEIEDIMERSYMLGRAGDSEEAEEEMKGIMAENFPESEGSE